MCQSEQENREKEIDRLQNDIRRLKKKIERQKHLEIRLNETLHSLRVHQEELRTQNEDLLIAQEEITRSHRTFRDLFDFAPIGYFLVDINGLVQEINLTGAAMIGRHRDIITGKPLFLFIQQDCREVLNSHLRKLWSGHRDSTEVVLTKGGGETLDVELFSLPVVDEQERITHARVAATDISRRRQAEKALKESERRLDTIIKNIPDIVYRLDRNGMISFISDRIRRYGYTPDELIGLPILHLIHPQDRAVAQSRVNERRTGDRSTIGLELRFKPGGVAAPADDDETGRDIYFMVNAEGLYVGRRKNADHFIGTQGIAHDITKRKQSVSTLKPSCTRRANWKPSVPWPAASPTTSTIC